MKTYKYTDATNTVVHVIDEDGVSRGSCMAAILPEGAIIAKADPQPVDFAGEIAELEQRNMMPRATREFMLAYMEMNATPEQLAANVGYQKVKAFDEQIRALRAQL